MPYLVDKTSPSSCNIKAESGILQSSRQVPYLSFRLTGAASLTLFPDTDSGTSAKLRKVADDLDTYWADWDAYNNARNPSAGIPLED